MARPFPLRLRRWLGWPTWLWSPFASEGPRASSRFLAEIRHRADAWRRLADGALIDRVRSLRVATQSDGSLSTVWRPFATTSAGTPSSGQRSLGTTEGAALAELFAAVDEAFFRQSGLRFYDVQFLAGRALSRRAIAEMRTGEGETFTTLLPAAWLA